MMPISAHRKWLDIGGLIPAPTTVDEAVARQAEIKNVTAIAIHDTGTHGIQVVGYLRADGERKFTGWLRTRRPRQPKPGVCRRFMLLIVTSLTLYFAANSLPRAPLFASLRISRTSNLFGLSFCST